MKKTTINAYNLEKKLINLFSEGKLRNTFVCFYTKFKTGKLKNIP